MRVGITYDLRQDYLDAGYGEVDTAEFDRPETIDAIEGALDALGHQPVRIGNLRRLAARLVAGDRWDLVFNIAEGLHGSGRESQVPALLEAYDVPYTFSDPLSCALTLHKGMAKRVVRDHGVPTPEFAVVQDIAELERCRLPLPLFAKPVAEGTGKGVSLASKIVSREQLCSVVQDLLERFGQPVLVERYLPGREFTVGMVGTGAQARAIGTMEVGLQPGAEAEVYSYLNKEHYQGLVRYTLLDEPHLRKRVEAVAVAAWRALECRDGGRVDIRLDVAGEPQFLEVNALAGVNPVHSDLPIICTLKGIEYETLIEWILDSAMARVAPPRQAGKHAAA